MQNILAKIGSRPLDPWAMVGAFALTLAITSVLLISLHGIDSLLFLFIIPILLAAMILEGRQYLIMCVLLFLAAVVVSMQLTKDLRATSNTILFTSLSLVLISEMIFRLAHSRRSLAKSLLIKQQEYQVISDHLPIGIYRANLQGQILHANLALAHLFGYETLEKFLAEFTLSPLTLSEERAISTLRMLKSQQGTFSQEVQVTLHEGKTIWVRDAGRSILDANGEIIYIDGIIEDITDRKNAEFRLEEERQLLRAIIDNLPDHIYTKDLNGHKLIANLADAQATGHSNPEQVIGKTDFELYPAELASRYWADDQNVLRSGVALVNRLEPGLDNSGEPRWMLTTKVPLRDQQGNVIGVVGIGRDITERRQVEEALHRANEKLTTWVGELEQRNREARLLNEMGEMLQSCQHIEDAYDVIGQYSKQIFPDLMGAFYVLNNSHNLLEMVARWGTLHGQTASLGEQVFSPEDCWALRRGHIHAVINTHDRLRCRHLNKSDRPTPLDDFESYPYFCIPLSAQGETLGLFHLKLDPAQSERDWQPTCTAVAERAALSLANLKLRDSLQAQAIRDPLTGLFNRRYMEETLEREMRRSIRYQRALGIIMLDIDHFKSFNDSFSYAAGDEFLRELGLFLKANLRADDITCRYGGEEFILILPEANLEDTTRRAEQLRQECKHLHVNHRGQSLGTISISLGVAAYPQHGESGEDVLRAVDTALHNAKSGGRDQVVVAPVLRQTIIKV